MAWFWQKREKEQGESTEEATAEENFKAPLTGYSEQAPEAKGEKKTSSKLKEELFIYEDNIGSEVRWTAIDPDTEFIRIKPDGQKVTMKLISAFDVRRLCSETIGGRERTVPTTIYNYDRQNGVIIVAQVDRADGEPKVKLVPVEERDGEALSRKVGELEPQLSSPFYDRANETLEESKRSRTEFADEGLQAGFSVARYEAKQRSEKLLAMDQAIKEAEASESLPTQQG